MKRQFRQPTPINDDVRSETFDTSAQAVEPAVCSRLSSLGGIPSGMFEWSTTIKESIYYQISGISGH
jgi:hypothetical protein